MSTAVIEPTSQVREPRPETRVDYLNVSFGWKSWLFTTDHKRIALLYLIAITAMFFIGGAFAVLIRIQLVMPSGALRRAGHLQQVFHRPRNHNGLLLPDSLHPGDARKFSRADDDRRQGPGVSEAKSV